MKKNISLKNLCIFILLFLFLLNSNLIYAGTASFNKFSSDDLKIIMTNVNRYNPIVDKYSEKFGVPSSIIKAVIGVEDMGTPLSPGNPYNQENEIGITHLVPFDENGDSVHYYDCLSSGCMNVEVENVDKQNLNNNKDNVKYEYVSPYNSICCTSFILSKYNFGSQSLVYKTNGCLNNRPDVDYVEWDASLRRYKGENYCHTDDDIYYVERVNQLVDMFEKFSNSNTISYGLLKFLPTFKVKMNNITNITNIYDKLKELIPKLQNDCSKPLTSYSSSIDCVDYLLTHFETENNVEFIHYCEEPEINQVNYVYDKIIAAIDMDSYSSCKYLILDKYTNFGIPQKFNLTISSNSTTNEFTVTNTYNNINSSLVNSQSAILPLLFKTYFPNITIQVSPLEAPNYDIILPNDDITNVEKIFVYSFTPSDPELIFLKNNSLTGNMTYYDALGLPYPAINETSVPNCTKTMENYKLKYFNCLDTKIKKPFFNSSTYEWEESDEDIIIKFSFALEKQ